MPSLSFLEYKFERQGQKPVILLGREKRKEQKETRILLRRRV